MAGDVKTITRRAAHNLIAAAVATIELRDGQECLVIKGYDIESDEETERIMRIVNEETSTE